MTKLRDRDSTDLVFRSFDVTDLELRASEDGKSLTFEGIASSVDVPYTATDMFGSYTETIKRGAYDRSLNAARAAKSAGEADIGLFISHQRMAMPLATVSAGTLTLKADPHLRVTGRLNPSRPSVQEVRGAIEDGEARQMSVGFKPVKDRNQWNQDGTEVVRTEVMLREVSIVWMGDNPHTVSGIRSLSDVVASFGDEPDEAELRRAIDALTKLLPPASVEERTAGGLFVTREMIEQFSRRFPAAS